MCLLFSGQITIRITLWAQLLLEFSTEHFETMHTCSTWSVDVHAVLGLSSLFFVNFFLLFRLRLFPGSVTIRIDTLWVKLLEFTTDHFETMRSCSTLSVDVHVVLDYRPFIFYQFVF